VAADLQRKGYVGKTIGVKLRYADFQIATRDYTLDHYTAQAQEIRQAAGQSLKRAPLQKRLRLLGVRVGSLLPAGQAKLLPTDKENPDDRNALFFPDD
jgi:DNA polymerase-4